MKKFVSEFLRRGVVACGIGPVVLAVIYLILYKTAGVETLQVGQVCTGIFSVTALAFIAGGLNAIYQLERLPLMVAILLHGAVLYGGYLVTYLLNSWLEWNAIAIAVFSGIFVVGYLVIWVIIYSVIKRNTLKLNESLRKRQQASE